MIYLLHMVMFQFAMLVYRKVIIKNPISPHEISLNPINIKSN